MSMEEKSVLIAMSGGVDSTVAACLLQRDGWRCQGANMHLQGDAGPGPDGREACGAQRDAEDAAAAAAMLGMPFEVLDLAGVFQREVIDKFIRVYQEGGTPNPCIDCNRRLKFGYFLQAAEARGLRSMATGHYARVAYDPERGRWLLRKALDASRDQSYVLYMLTQEQLARLQLPLGELTKGQVREIAEKEGFVNARKHDSQDICFVPDGDYAAFIQRQTGAPLPPGDFLDLEGRTVGRHRGAVRYTLGQRKGLGLAMGAPVYVCGKDMRANTVTVGPEAALYSRRVRVEDLNWIAIDGLTGPLRVKAKTRYRQAEQWAELRPAEGGVLLEFDQPQRAVTPGQAAVFYDGDAVVGGGTITAAGNDL